MDTVLKNKSRSKSFQRNLLLSLGGVFLLFAIMRGIVTRVMLAFMVVMTLVTVWIWMADPVSDCGCFGDAIRLTNGETLLKNIILLGLVCLVAKWPMKNRKR